LRSAGQIKNDAVRVEPERRKQQRVVMVVLPGIIADDESPSVR
jgi:hypothetical protein